MNDIIEELNRGVGEIIDTRLAEYLEKLDRENYASEVRWRRLVGQVDYLPADHGEPPLGGKW